MIEIEIDDEAWIKAVPRAEEACRLAAEAAVARDVVILLTDNETMRDLNARFRGKDSPTNVLSFPAAPTAEGHLGDIALAFGVCEAEAREQGKTLSAHLQHLVIHGVLHLIGYDHQADADAERMETRERELLAGLGIPDPYAT